MNRTLIAIFIVVLVISLLFAPGKAVAIGISIPLAGLLVALLYKVISRWRRRGDDEKIRDRQARIFSRKQKLLAEEENKRKLQEESLRNAEALENARQESRVKALAEATRKERKLACLQYAAEHFLVDCLLIDSKVWMSDECGSFFYVLEQACREKGGYKLVMDAEQLDEMRGGGAVDQSPRAKLAVERIEQLQSKGLLAVSEAGLVSDPALADEPLVIRQMDSAIRSGRVTTFVTDDRDMRIRVRKYLYKSTNARVDIVSLESIIQDCRDVHAADQSFVAAETVSDFPQA